MVVVVDAPKVVCTRQGDPQAPLHLGSTGSGLSLGDATHTLRTSLGCDLVEFQVLTSDFLTRKLCSTQSGILPGE